MTDERFIKSIIREAEYLIKDVDSDMDYEITRVTVIYSLKKFIKIKELLEEINKNSSDVEITIFNESRKEVLISYKDNKS